MGRKGNGKVYWLAILGLAIAAVPAVISAPTERGKPNEGDEVTNTPEEPANQRVGGDLEVKVERRGFSYFAGEASITTPLPEGYPAPTPPGAIEIKYYPSVRRAQVTVSGEIDPDRGQNASFWPLFRHIEANGIAMTAPVEMEYTGLDASGRGDLQSWTMAFLYRSPDLHPTGADAANEDVLITDSEPLTVLSAGYTGDYSLLRVRAELFRMNKWLEGQTEWEVAGDPRSFGYNDPSVPRARRWGEVQVPIRKVEQPSETAPAPHSKGDEPARDPGEVR